MELKIPTSEEAYWGLRAMKTVAQADGRFGDSERHMMEAVQRVIGTATRWHPSRRPSWPLRFPTDRSGVSWYTA